MIKLFRFIGKQWWQVVLVVVLVFIHSYLSLELPQYTGKITQYITEAAGTPEGIQSAKIWEYGFTMLGISLIVFVLMVIVMAINVHISSMFANRLRHAIFTHTQEVSLNEFQKFGTASLLTRITVDVRNVKNMLQFGARLLIMSPTILIVAIIRVIPINPRYIFIVALGIPVLLIVLITILIKAGPLFTAIQKKIDRVTLLMREGLTGVRVVRAFNQEKRENKYFDQANKDMTDTTVKAVRTTSFLGPTINIVMNVTFVAVYIVAFALLNNQLIVTADDGLRVMNSFSEAVVISQYVMQIMMSLVMLGFLFVMLPQASASAKRINEILDTKNTILDPINPIVDTKTTGVVEFRDVTFKFPDADVPTLCKITFKTTPGTVTAIIGSTGSGKSSIINLIPRFYDVTEGELLVDGINVKDYTQNNLREKIGFVPQQALLFSGTIRDNLLFGNAAADNKQLDVALEIAQAKNFVMKLNKDESLDQEAALSLALEAKVAQGGRNFSGGQKQRLSIARALVKKPEIYIFDDSFSALDFKTDIRLRSALKNYTKESSVIIVAQRVSSIMDADQIIVLDDGKIAGIGKHNKLLEDCAVYQEIVNSQLDPEEVEKTKLMRQQILAGEGGNNNG